MPLTVNPLSNQATWFRISSQASQYTPPSSVPQLQQQQIIPAAPSAPELQCDNQNPLIYPLANKASLGTGTNPPTTQNAVTIQLAETNPWHLKPVYRRQGQTAEDWCLRFYNTHVDAAYSEKDLSKIIDDVRGVDKEIQWLVNTSDIVYYFANVQL